MTSLAVLELVSTYPDIPPNIPDKDAALFPKKIKGKFVILHRLGVSIWLDYVATCNLEVKSGSREMLL